MADSRCLVFPGTAIEDMRTDDVLVAARIDNAAVVVEPGAWDSGHWSSGQDDGDDCTTRARFDRPPAPTSTLPLEQIGQAPSPSPPVLADDLLLVSGHQYCYGSCDTEPLKTFVSRPFPPPS